MRAVNKAVKIYPGVDLDRAIHLVHSYLHGSENEHNLTAQNPGIHNTLCIYVYNRMQDGGKDTYIVYHTATELIVRQESNQEYERLTSAVDRRGGSKAVREIDPIA